MPLARAITVGLVLAAPALATAGPCPSDKPILLGGLKCDDPAAQTWYQVEVYRRCEVHRGQPQPVLEVAERTPAGKEVRRRVGLAAVRSFVQDQMLAGHDPPRLFVTKLPGGTTKPTQICGEQTRTTLDTLTCDVGGHEVHLDVDGMCTKLLGQPISALSFVERSGKRRKVRKVFNHNDARVLCAQNKGQPRARIWKGRGPKRAGLEATALLRPDGRGIDLVEVQIIPAQGKPCKRVVEVARVWAAEWPVVPRLGFVEAVAIASRDLGRLEQVVITIAPLASPPCQRAIDVHALWDAYR